MTATDYIFLGALSLALNAAIGWRCYKAGMARGIEHEQDRTHARHMRPNGEKVSGNN